jgi:hypothetical protein
MDITRRQWLRDSLEGQLEDEASRKNLSANQRVLWMAGRLEDYVGRLVGALSLPEWTMLDIIGSESLDIVEIGAEVMEKELLKTNMAEASRTVWREFLVQLGKIREGGEEEHVHRLGDLIKRLCTLIDVD